MFYLFSYYVTRLSSRLTDEGLTNDVSYHDTLQYRINKKNDKNKMIMSYVYFVRQIEKCYYSDEEIKWIHT